MRVSSAGRQIRRAICSYDSTAIQAKPPTITSAAPISTATTAWCRAAGARAAVSPGAELTGSW